MTMRMIGEGKTKMDELWFKGQKRIIIKKLIKYSILFLFIGLFIGIWLGQAWRIIQVEPTRDKEIASLKNQVDHYRNHWTPIREKEILKSKQEIKKK